MTTVIHEKGLRDLRVMVAQALAVGCVVGAGVALLVARAANHGNGSRNGIQ